MKNPYRESDWSPKSYCGGYLTAAASYLSAVMVGVGMTYVLFGLWQCGGSSTPAGYPTPAQAASYDVRVTDCAVTGKSRAEIDACRAEAVATYCANFPAQAMCPKDAGGQ